MKNEATLITWDLHPPPGVIAPAPDWLIELAEMRGRVLYAGGRRPTFRLPDGRFADCDTLDAYAYHLMARAPSGPVGCIRLVPLADAPGCVTEELIGCQRFGEVLTELNVRRNQVAECGRWIVVPEYRRTTLMLGIRLAGGIAAVGRQLGHKLLIGPLGTRDGQADLLMRLGMHPLPNVAPLPIPIYEDEIQISYIDPYCPGPTLAVLITQMERRLVLDQC
jgi:Acetyltransferase (GNAT) domain